MDGTGDHYDGLAFSLKAQGIRGRRLSRIGETGLNVAVMVEIFYVRGRGDHGGNHGPAFGRLAQFEKFDPIARSRQSFEVAHDLIPVEKFVVHAHLVAEMAFRRGNGCHRLGSGRE